MKQVISIADFATILNLINNEIIYMERNAILNMGWRINEAQEEIEKRQQEKIRELQKNAHYNSLLHAKKALQECNIEIEVPDLKVVE